MDVSHIGACLSHLPNVSKDEEGPSEDEMGEVTNEQGGVGGLGRSGGFNCIGVSWVEGVREGHRGCRGRRREGLKLCGGGGVVGWRW